MPGREDAQATPAGAARARPGSADGVPPPLLVADLSVGIAGSLCAKLLAMGGATVVKLAQDADGDGSAPGPEDPVSERARRWVREYADASKLGVSLDPATPDDRRVAEELVAAADVVVTSFDGGRYHGPFDEEEVRRRNPRAVHVTLSSFGVTGPYAAWKGSSLVEWAASGYLHITGDRDREPLAGPEGVCGGVAAYAAAMAVEAALADRERTGLGQHIDAAVMQVMLGAHQSTFSRLSAGMVMDRSANEYTTVYPVNIHPCRDGRLLVSVVTDDDFDRLAVAIGSPELVIDERLSTGPDRFRHRDLVDAHLHPWLAERDGDDAAELLQRAGVVAAKVATTTDVLADPQLASRRYFDAVALSSPDGPVRARMPGNPVAMAGASAPAAHATRRAGDGRAALEEILSGVRARPHARGPRPDPEGDASPSPGPLGLGAGERPVTVLDATIWWAGPMATRLLADLGARVIRVERPGGRVDTYHDSGAFVTHKMHRGKLSVAVDTRTEEGRAIVHELVRSADVFVENFRPGVMDRLGLGHETLSSINPSLVYVSLSGFGSVGPRARWGSHGTLIEAASSIESRTAYPDGEPMKLGHPLPDAVGGLAGALAALRGLRHRRQTGSGAYFDVSQLETYCSTGGDAILESSVTGVAATPLGNASGWAAPQNVYRCAGEDTWLAVTVADAGQWRALVAVVGHGPGGALADPAFDAAERRRRHQAEIDAVIGAWTRARDKRDAAAALQGAGVPAFPVLSASDAVADPHVVARSILVAADVHGEPATLPGTPVATARPLFGIGRAAPVLGEHTRQILASDLGMAPEAIARLEASRVVACADAGRGGPARAGGGR